MFTTTKHNIPLLAFFSAIAIIISLIEGFLALDFIIVGAKLGLANIVTNFVIIYFGRYQALLVLLTRVFVVTLLSGRLSSILFSLLGGLFSYTACCILTRYYKNSVTFVGINILSSAFHHIGQILAAVILLSSINIIAYLPYLLAISIPIGYITGKLQEVLFHRLEDIYVNNSS